MCGINGFNWPDSDLINKMGEAIRHRGPDDRGSFVDDSVSLGNVRLAIIDLTSAGRQPMSNEDERMWVVYNGEIYNYLELREKLVALGHSFKSNTDSEVVIHAYEEWREKCVDEFLGMWAFAVYDREQSRLFLSRDRFGVKPLYYYSRAGKFIFSSEIKGILEHPIPISPCDKSIKEYLSSGHLDHERDTFFNDVRRLMPGENLVLDVHTGSFSLSKWYDLRSSQSKNGVSDELDTVESLRALFLSSICYQLVADVPIGSCLSGGIDSSSIVCSMRLNNSARSIKTYSLTFPGQKIDETTYINEVVKSTGATSHSVSPNPSALVDDLSDLVWTQEEPFASLSIYGQYKVMQLAHEQGAKVLLDGQGGDEVFAGYERYFGAYLLECLVGLDLEGVRTCVQARKGKLLADLKSMLFNASYLLPKDESESRTIFKTTDTNNCAGTQTTRAKPMKIVNKVLLDDLLIFTIPQYLRYEDKNSMRWGVESRVPFLDHRLVEFAFSLPSNQKLGGGITKKILRMAMVAILPESIRTRRDKIGFAAPDADWMRSSEFSQMALRLMESESFESRGYWKADSVLRIYHRHLQGIGDNHSLIWRIINTELWFRLFIDKSVESQKRTG